MQGVMTSSWYHRHCETQLGPAEPRYIAAPRHYGRDTRSMITDYGMRHHDYPLLLPRPTRRLRTVSLGDSAGCRSIIVRYEQT